MKAPNIGVLDEAFLTGLRGLLQKYLALEMLRKLLNDEIKARGRRNGVQARSFAATLEDTLKRYQNRSLETAQVINEPIDLAQQLKATHQHEEALGLSKEELAVCDVLEVNDNVAQVLSVETLRESVRTNLRRMVQRVLRKHGYLPDKLRRPRWPYWTRRIGKD